jgi:hypothetical protein
MKVRDSKNIGTSTLIGLLLVSTLVIAGNQTNYVNAEEQPSDSSSATSASSDEVTAASGSNRFVVWQDDTPGNQDIFFKRSTDNGATWKSTVNLSNNFADSISPLISVSGSHVYVVWLQWSASHTTIDIFLRHSSDNGATWKTSINISKSFGLSHVQQLSVSGSNVYVIWQDDTFGNDDVLFRRSTDNGATWKPFVNLSNNPSDSLSPQIAASGSNVYVTWFDQTSGEILFRRSADNGATWKTVQNLSSNPGFSGSPKIAVSGSNVYVVWGQASADNTSFDIFFRRSTDNGATWKSKVNVSNDGASGGEQKIAVSGSNVYVVYQGGTDVLFRRSTDNGDTWKPKVNLSNDPANSQNHEIAATGSNVYVVWNDVADPDNAEVLFTRSTDNGATWKSIKNFSNNPSNSGEPRVSATGSEVYIVWSDLVSLNYDILLKRSTNNGATWNPLKNISNNGGSSFSPQIAI